jgi:DNA-binding MarR family transcriptional regulator/GNAT superfamily N-acetyltransferase
MEHISCVRSFNRAVSQRIGALEESYLSRGRPLGQARLIFEIGSAGGIDLSRLRSKLGLDSGYMSRLLRSLESQGLLQLHPKDGDGRSRRVELTERGEAEFRAYDALSDDLAKSILERLSEGQKDRLAKAMADVERLLVAGSVDVTLEPAHSADAAWCLMQYQQELDVRFGEGFDPSNGNSFEPEDATPPHGWFVVARLAGDPIGCGALKQLDVRTGEIKRVWVGKSTRGMGVSVRIMERLEALAVEAGFSLIRLDTNRALTEAHALYCKLGYREIARYNDNPYADHFFEKTL